MNIVDISFDIICIFSANKFDYNCQWGADNTAKGVISMWPWGNSV